MKFFSQHGEDCLIWQFFDRKTTGFYVDVGAFDGVHVSNTYAFEQVGWSGICVEPLPSMFALCRQQRPNAVCVNTACAADNRRTEMEFYVEELGLLSGLQADRDDDVRRRYERRGLSFSGFTTIRVPVRTLTSILDEYLPAAAQIDFISIDVEGTELDVLRGLDFKRYQPRLIVVEANTAAHQEALVQFMAKIGYMPARRLGVNMVFAHTSGDVEALRTITIDCYIEPTVHPSGLTYTLDKSAQRRRIHNPGTGGKQLYRSAPTARLKHTIKRLLRIKPS